MTYSPWHALVDDKGERIGVFQYPLLDRDWPTSFPYIQFQVGSPGVPEFVIRPSPWPYPPETWVKFGTLSRTWDSIGQPAWRLHDAAPADFERLPGVLLVPSFGYLERMIEHAERYADLCNS